MPGLRLLAGVDIDKEIIEENKFLATASACCWLEERPEDFITELWKVLCYNVNVLVGAFNQGSRRGPLHDYYN